MRRKQATGTHLDLPAVEPSDQWESLRVAVEEMKAGKGRPIEAMFAEMEVRLAMEKAKVKNA